MYGTANPRPWIAFLACSGGLKPIGAELAETAFGFARWRTKQVVATLVGGRKRTAYPEPGNAAPTVASYKNPAASASVQQPAVFHQFFPIHGRRRRA